MNVFENPEVMVVLLFFGTIRCAELYVTEDLSSDF